MSPNTVFFVSHVPQIKWYTVLARACKSFFPDCRTVLFVHGRAEREYASQFPEYDEIVDLIGGFEYDPSIPIAQVPSSPELLRLEADLGASFFWEDVKVDRWLRVKNNPSFTAQYLNHAFNLLHSKYQKYRPVCGWGESTLAIYRFAHRLFDRDGLPYLAPIGTRYFDRFYIEHDWYWKWEESVADYRKFLREGVPGEVLREVLPVYTRIVEKSGKPTAFANFTKANSKGYPDHDWFGVKRNMQVLSKLMTIDRSELKNNFRYAAVESSVLQKLVRYGANRRNYRDYLSLVSPELPKGIKYCSYFLHYQPEYTVDSLGKFYSDQNYLISNIASAIPGDHYLVVKDHVTMVGLRPKSFYEDIKRSPNVILLTHTVDSFDLIKRSKLVFTIVGTSALEAMFLGVPAIMFGKYAFDTTNMISLADNFWGLPGLIREKLAEKHDKDEVRSNAIALLAGKFHGSLPGKIPAAESEIDSFVNNAAEFERVRASTEKWLAARFGAKGGRLSAGGRQVSPA